MPKRKPKRRNKGLVIGFVERVGSGVFDSYTQEIADLVGGRHGIYALYRNNKLYYVGLASNLRSRLRSHLRDRHAGRWNYFSMYFVRSERNLRDLESLAMRISHPKGNKARGKFGGAPDLRKALHRKMKDSAMREIGEVLGPVRGTSGLSKSRTRAAIKAWRTRRRNSTSRRPLKGLLANRRLKMVWHGKVYTGWVCRNGRIRVNHTGEWFDTPSGAAKAVRGAPSDGWWWWKLRNSAGEWVRLRDGLSHG